MADTSGRSRFRPGEAPTVWLLAALSVASAVLSAVAFWESTRLGDEAEESVERARYAQVEQDLRRSTLRAKIDHDLGISSRCRSAAQRRDDALIRYSRSFDGDHLAAVVEAELARSTLGSLGVTSTPVCDPLDRTAVTTILAVAETEPAVFEAGDAGALRLRAERLGDAERLAVWATVCFALALLFLAVAEHTETTRRLRGGLALAATSMLGGFALISASSVTAGQVPVTAVVVTLASAVVMASLAVLVSRGRPPLRSLSERLQGHERLLAEVLGAISVVVLTLSALGFTHSAIAEREALADADALASEARRALEIGEQSTLAVLRSLEALAVAAAVPSDVDPAAWETALAGSWGAEREAWETMLEQHGEQERAPSGPTCLDDETLEAVLPWAPGTAESRPSAADGPPAAARFPADVLSEFRESPPVVVHLVEASGTASLACSTHATVMSQQALRWGDRALAFAVALVILGLAGFLFAMAVSENTHSAPRHWLLAAAVAGLVVGSSLAGVAWRRIPADVDPERVSDGALAFAQSRAARLSGDCESAERRADLALDALPRFAPAHENRALAALCVPSSDAWLAKPDVPEAQREDALRGLEEAVDGLGKADSGALGNLGWTYLLEALARIRQGQDDEGALHRGEELTTRALEADPTNHYACLNRALAALAANAVAEANERYTEAVAALRGETREDGSCRSSGLSNSAAGQRTFRLLALADLELLPITGASDAIRELLVGGGRGGPVADQAERGRWSLDVLPQEIGLLLDGQAADSRGDVSAVWYHRRAQTGTWGVLWHPTLTTLAPGHHAGYWRPGALLPDGDYRVDVYRGGRLVERVETTSDSWRDMGLDHGDYRQLHLVDLGMTAVVPRDWRTVWSEWGRSVRYEGDAGWLEVRRREGTTRQDLVSQLASWSGVPAAELRSGASYLGLGAAVTATTDDGVLVGAGHGQYLEAERPDQFFDLEHETCPGATVMSQVRAEDPAVADLVWRQQILDGRPFAVTMERVGLKGAYDGPQLSMGIPDGWTAAACPGRFAAQAPDREANVLVGVEPLSVPLSAYVSEQIAAEQRDFADYELLDRRPVTLSNGVPAEQITFTWSSDPHPVQQLQLYAQTGHQVHFLTFTATQEQYEAVASARERLLCSFQPGAERRPVRCGRPAGGDR